MIGAIGGAVAGYYVMKGNAAQDGWDPTGLNAFGRQLKGVGGAIVGGVLGHFLYDRRR